MPYIPIFLRCKGILAPCILIDYMKYFLLFISRVIVCRIVIHSAQERPLPNEFGLDLNPAQSTNLAIQAVRVTQLELN